MKSYYKRNDVLQALAFQASNRELGFYWSRDHTIRPLKAESLEELRSLLERYGSNEPFGIFRSVEEFSDPLKLNDDSPSSLRVGWDFILDLDSDDFEASRRATVKTVKLLELFNLPYLLKFSGRRGFHFIIPGRVFDVGSQREWLDAYPDLPKMIAKFIEACLNEPKVKLDHSIYTPRRLIRCAYSLHEKSQFVSIPVEDPMVFQLEEAKPENVKADLERLKVPYEIGSGLELVKAVGDWFKDRHEEPAVKILKYGYSKGEGKPYGWIERLLEHPVDDGRHRILWLILAPYMVNVKMLPLEDAEEQILEYLRKCSELKPISSNLKGLIHYYLNYAKRKGLKPLSLQTLRSKEEYTDLYEIVSKALKGSKYMNNGGSRKPTYKDFAIVGASDEYAKYPLIAIKVVEKELEYEVEESTLEEARAVVKKLLPKFRKYPKNEHWSEDEEENLLLGWLGEKVFDMTLNQFKVQHVWNHPIIQDALIGERKQSEPDFIIGSDKVDVKCSSLRKRPEAYYVNKRRFEDHYADIYIFIRFNENLSRAWISGWLERKQIEAKTVRSLKYGEAYEIPLKELNPLITLLKRWNVDNFMLKLFYG